MTIHYTDGRTIEGVILSRQDQTVRVALQGHADTAIFQNLFGTWVSEDCEPVHMEFAWQGQKRPDAVSEADCICPRELAAHLIHLLMNGDADDLTETVLPRPLVMAAGSCLTM